MEQIPEYIRSKLNSCGYDAIDKFPSNEDLDQWNLLQKDCDLSTSHVNDLMQIRFPAQGKLVRFRWKESQYKFGENFLPRDRVMKKVKDEIASYREMSPGESVSVYLQGCRGLGKTSNLNLLAKSFKAEGYDVYYFESSLEIPVDRSYFESVLEDREKMIAVLIDNVATYPAHSLFSTLLKGPYPNLVTIVVGESPSYFPQRLKRARWLTMTDMMLKEDDEDVKELIKYYVKKEVATPELTEEICKYILTQCGGHTYPTLAFIEHFFTGDGKNHVVNFQDFCRHYDGGEFELTNLYKSVVYSTFGPLLEEYAEIVARVIKGKDLRDDIIAISHLGWMNRGDFISDLLTNVCRRASTAAALRREMDSNTRFPNNTGSTRSFCTSTSSAIVPKLSRGSLGQTRSFSTSTLLPLRFPVKCQRAVRPVQWLSVLKRCLALVK